MPSKIKALHSPSNLGAIRLYLATTVFLYHIYALSQSERLWPLALLNPEFAVQGFFVISGYLIIRSASNPGGLGNYWRNRFLRIYPAYLAALFLGVILAVGVSSVRLGDFLLSRELWRYVLANVFFLSFLAQNLPGAFDQNYLHAVNGALWTIKIEVGFYLVAPVFARLLRSSLRHYLLPVLFLGSLAYAHYFTMLHDRTGREIFLIVARQLPGQLCYFVAGMAYYCYESELSKYVTKIFFCSAGAFILCQFWPLFAAIAYPVAVGGVIMGLAFFPSRLAALDAVGDFSYGTYVYHFPLVQTFIALGAFNGARRDYVAALLCALAVMALAVASWFWVERPALGLKKRKAAIGLPPFPSVHPSS